MQFSTQVLDGINMEIRGFEPLTSSLQSWRSSQLSYIPALLTSFITKSKNDNLTKKRERESCVSGGAARSRFRVPVTLLQKLFYRFLP